MKINFCNREFGFQRWKPSYGTVFQRPYAFDTETTLIDDARSWLPPAYVLGAACDGTKGYFIERRNLRQFLDHHKGIAMVMHNAAFDLDVINLVVPELDIYQLVDGNRVWDTELLHRLYTLGTKGDVSPGKGQSTLDRCVETYLGGQLPKDTKDSRDRLVRLSYGQWLNRPFKSIERVYLEYVAKDVAATYLLYHRLRRLLKQMSEDALDTWGYVTAEWLTKQTKRWGPQTHHIQVKASIVLRAVTANGMGVDLARRAELEGRLQHVADEKLALLRQHGYQPGQKGCNKALQEILREIDYRHPDLRLPRTPARGEYKASQEVLEQLQGVEPFIDALLAYRAVQKLLSSFLPKMAKRVVHPGFRAVIKTGRTSSSGEINAQNLPRDDRVRSCFVPPPGHVFIDADYSAVEMATLAQAVTGQFGLRSRLAEVLNAGRDPHRLFAARVMGKAEEDVTKEERQKAKAINFGKPGGMGVKTLTAYAKTSYGIQLDEEEAQELDRAWFDEFPEMEEFLHGGEDLGEEVAVFFNLTPFTYFDHTESRVFLDHPDNEGFAHHAHPALGGMFLKTLKEREPRTRGGRDYTPEELDYFWSMIAERIDELPSEIHHAVQNRTPSVDLSKRIIQCVGRSGVFTYTGRLRANATYSARHNTVFQGLAADGAKLGLWKTWRAGYRIVNFIHDELLVAVPADSNLAFHAEAIGHLMLQGMKAVVPDIRIGVEYVITDRWYKQAKLSLDSKGRLVPWAAGEETSGTIAS